MESGELKLEDVLDRTKWKRESLFWQPQMMAKARAEEELDYLIYIVHGSKNPNDSKL